jgi:multiple sugar transport system permease protein
MATATARAESFAETGPAEPVVESVRVDQIMPRAKMTKKIRLILAIIAAIIMLIPVYWMATTAIKSRPDAVSAPPKIFFVPSLDGFIGLFFDRSQISQTELAEYKNRTDLSFVERQALVRGMKVLGPSKYVGRLGNSVIIAFTSTALAIFLGVLAAYAFSRWEVPGESDLLFFILSTRMLPAVVVTIPIFLMYRALGLYDTHFGMIMLYTCFNLSFAVWLLKGFIDEIPKE